MPTPTDRGTHVELHDIYEARQRMKSLLSRLLQRPTEDMPLSGVLLCGSIFLRSTVTMRNAISVRLRTSPICTFLTFLKILRFDRRITICGIFALTSVGMFFFLQNTFIKRADPRHELRSPDGSTVVYRFPPLLSDEQEALTHSFELSNNSHRTLTISRIRKSCSCTSADINIRTLKPGSMATLAMRSDIRGRIGAFATECVVPDDEKGDTHWRCRMEALILENIVFKPQALMLGHLKAKSPVARTFVLISRSRHRAPPDPIVRVFSNTNDKPTVSIGDSTLKTIPGGLYERATSLVLQLTPKSGSDSHSCRIDALTETGERATASVIANWLVDEPFQLSPSVALFSAEREPTWHRSVTITRDDHRAFRILRLTCNLPTITCSCTTKGDLSAQHKIDLSVAATDVSGFLSTTGTIAVDDRDCPSVLFRILAYNPPQTK